jgi:hypothetical protein
MAFLGKNLQMETIPEPPKGPLGRPELLALAVGQVIGAGVVTLVGPAIAYTGYSAWLAYFAAIVLGLVYILPIVFITGTVRLGGGQYSMVSGILGPIPAGFQAISCLTGSFACALFATSIGGYVNDLLPFIPAQIASITFLTLFFVINLFGVNIMAKVQKLMTWCLLAALMLFIVFGLFHLQNPIFDFHSGDFLSGGFKGFVSATMLLYYSTTGHYLTMNYSRTAQNATRDIPWAMLMATPVLLVVYCGVAIVATGVLPMADTAGRCGPEHLPRAALHPVHHLRAHVCAVHHHERHHGGHPLHDRPVRVRRLAAQEFRGQKQARRVLEDPGVCIPLFPDPRHLQLQHLRNQQQHAALQLLCHLHPAVRLFPYALQIPGGLETLPLACAQPRVLSVLRFVRGAEHLRALQLLCDAEPRGGHR